VEQEVVSPEFVAEELTAAGVVAANAAALHKLLGVSGLGGVHQQRLKLLLLGVAVAGYGWRLVLRVIRRTVEVGGWRGRGPGRSWPAAAPRGSQVCTAAECGGCGLTRPPGPRTPPLGPAGRAHAG
jgi:hypothetical protein